MCLGRGRGGQVQDEIWGEVLVGHQPTTLWNSPAWILLAIRLSQLLAIWQSDCEDFSFFEWGSLQDTNQQQILRHEFCFQSFILIGQIFSWMPFLVVWCIWVQIYVSWFWSKAVWWILSCSAALVHFCVVSLASVAVHRTPGRSICYWFLSLVCLFVYLLVCLSLVLFSCCCNLLVCSWLHPWVHYQADIGFIPLDLFILLLFSNHARHHIHFI